MWVPPETEGEVTFSSQLACVMAQEIVPSSFHRESSVPAAQMSSLNSDLNSGEIQFLSGYPGAGAMSSSHILFPDHTENNLYKEKWRPAAQTAGLCDRGGPYSSYVFIMFWN